MPKRALTPQEKLHNAINRRQALLTKHNNNTDLLASKGYEYNKTKAPALKQFNKDWNLLRRLNKTIRDLEKTDQIPLPQDQQLRQQDSLSHQDTNTYVTTNIPTTAVEERCSGGQRTSYGYRCRGCNDDNERSSSNDDQRGGGGDENMNITTNENDNTSTRSNDNIEDVSDNSSGYNSESDIDSSSISDNSSTTTINGNNNGEEQPQQHECHNCRRCFDDSIIRPHGTSSFYDIQFVTRSSDNIVQRRRFKHISFRSRNPTIYTLCTQCDFYLNPENKSDDNDFDDVVWCSFYWSLLSNRNVHMQYGQSIWRFVPTEWRSWWLDSLSTTFPNVFTDISLDYPSPVFKDKTTDLKDWKDDISSYLLSRLAKTCNKHLIPSIKCPWGCTEFQHKVGSLPLDVMLQRILQKVTIKMHTNADLAMEKKVLFVREDYIRDESDEDDCWLFNNRWKILPSIAFIESKGPVVLTCRDHHNGSKLFVVHPCRWIHNLNSSQPDQLCQAVIQPRVIKPVKAKKYSMSFQMFQQTGTFNGIDTCSATSFGNFDFQSKLIFEAEARSITNRPDINALLTKLQKENIISSHIENGRRLFASTFSSSVDYSRYWKGATYVPLESSIILQNENNNSLISAWLDHTNINNHTGTRPPPTRLTFKKYWSDTLYPCQNMSEYGVRFPKLPIFQNCNQRGTRTIWTVATLIARIECLWYYISNNVEFRTSNWHGWLLVYLYKHCFNEGSKRQARKDPFKIGYMRSIDSLLAKVVGRRNNLSSYFNDPNLTELLYLDLPTNFDGDLAHVISNNTPPNFSSINIIIINRFKENEIVDEQIEIHDQPFELRTIVGSRSIGVRDGSWDGVIYSRHGGPFKKWWMDERRQNIPIQIDTLPLQLPYNDNYTLVYIRVNQQNIEKLRNQFMQNIGGQVHVQCIHHRLPLITSMDRNKKCACGKSNHYQCSDLSCDVCLCRKCFDAIEVNDNGGGATTFISSVTTPNHDENRNDNNDEVVQLDGDNISVTSRSSSSIESISSEELEEPFDHEEQLRQFLYENDQNQEEDGGNDQFDDFLLTSNEPDEFDVEEVSDGIEEERRQPLRENIFLEGLGVLPTTNAGDTARTINEETAYGGSLSNITISGHVLLNQCGTLLSRKKHQIKGSSRHHYFLQRIVATSHGSSVPLMYPEGILFPSIHWKMAPDNCSIVGSLPAPLLTEASNGSRFASIQCHVRSRLTNSSCSTSTDPRYCAHCYDMLTNASANHEDTRLILNRGLTVGNDKTGGLGLRGKGDSSLLESVDNKQMVRNLCTSQKYVQWDHFLTHTCNMKTHFGTAPVKDWIDGNEWKKNYPGGYFNLEYDERREIDQAVLESSGPLLHRIWEEAFLLLVDYLKKSPSSPFKRFLALFLRKEYQKDRGNLDHGHMMLALNWALMNEDERRFVNDLIRASIYDIVRSDEIPKMIEEGIFTHPEDVHSVYKDAEKFLAHRCNDSCLVRLPDGSLRCRKINNVKASPDNTKHVFQPLPNDYSVPCLRILEEIGLTSKLNIDDDGNVLEFESPLSFFHPNRHIPPTNPTNDMNISPVEGSTFAVTRSMQNVQRLTGTGGCAKYVCKYIAKMDEQNYVVVQVDGEGQLVTQATFLHNTKITSSKIGEDKERKKHDGKPQGRCISHLEMLHMQLKYPEVITNLDFVKVTTMPLELRGGMLIDSDVQQGEDGAYVGCAIDVFRRSLEGLEEWRMMTPSQLLIIDDLKLSKVSVDKVTQFSLRPPELLSLFDTLGEYFRWFVIGTSKVPNNGFNTYITDELDESCWIDCLQRRIRVRKKALPEIMDYINSIQQEDDEDEGKRKTIALFRRINQCVTNTHGTTLNEHDSDEEDEQGHFHWHVYQNLLFEDDDKDLLPIPVFSYITPTLTTSFLLHIMLSMGHFETEVDILMHENLRECLRYCKLIGERNDEESLKLYVNDLTKRYIIEQLQYFPNSKRVIDHWIVTARNLFVAVIVNDELPISEMPPVQLSNILSSQEEDILNYRVGVKQNIIEAAYKELGEASIRCCHIPSKEELMEASSDNQLNWDPVNSLCRNPSQSEESFNEQQFAIKKAVESIDRYRDFTFQTSYTKNLGIRGSPGGGKTWCMMYLVLYAISQGNVVVTTALMCKRAIHLGGVHIAQLFKNPSESTASTHRQAELAILSLMRKPEKLEFLRALNIIFFDEMGQVSDTMLAILDIILRKIRNSNIYMGGVLVVFSMDHTQIQPIRGRPFLTSCHVIPCFQMVALEHSVRASNDTDFVRIQKIARMNYKKFEDDPNLVNTFITLCSNSFTFVDSWESDIILPTTMRLYSKRIPAREASRQFVASVRRQIASNEFIERNAEDTEKPANSRVDWMPATENTSSQMEQKVKEPQLLLFFRGAIFEMTFNVEGKFSNTQTCILFDIPTMDDLQNWRKIKVLKTPPGLREIVFDPDASKQDYIDKGFIEVSVGVAPGRTQYLSGVIQAKRKQYGLKHHFTSTIHAAMGDTLSSMATEVSFTNSNFKMWDKGQMIVILSRTRRARDTIFVGDKTDTLNALRHLLMRKTQWTDYMEDVLEIITLKNEEERANEHASNEEGVEVQRAAAAGRQRRRIMNQSAFPFRICDISLPQCNTGYVYMLISMKNYNYTYIGKTNSIRRRMREHNSGVGSVSTEPIHLRPFALFAYICGANCNDNLLLYLEHQWKLKRDRLIMNGVNNVKEWAYSGNDIISELNSQTFGVRPSDLTLVILFKE